MKPWTLYLLFALLTGNSFSQINEVQLEKLFEKGAKQIGVQAMNAEMAEYLRSPAFLDGYGLKDVTHKLSAHDLLQIEEHHPQAEWVILSPRKGKYKAFECAILETFRRLSLLHRAGPVIRSSERGIGILENEVRVIVKELRTYQDWENLFEAYGLEIIHQFPTSSRAVSTALKASDATGMGMVEVVSRLRRRFPEGKVSYLIDGETYPILH